MKLSELGQVSVSDGSMILIQLWDKSAIEMVSKEIESSGITLLKFISLVIPSPLHLEQAPFGELKEKVLEVLVLSNTITQTHSRFEPGQNVHEVYEKLKLLLHDSNQVMRTCLPGEPRGIRRSTPSCECRRL